MARETIFEEQAVSGFWLADQYGMYAKSIMPAPFSLTAGEEYIVIWENVEYPVTAIDISALFPGGVAVGNGSGFGLPGNNEPFIVAAFETDVALFVLDPTDTRDTHSFGIYKSVEEAVYYSVSSLSLKAIGNAIRAKTGSSDELSFPAGMVQAINGITGSGGGSGDYTDAVYTVTFMNGSEFLYARAVADGDNCADVVSRGLVSTPTKASTAQYDYTHNGWSLTDGDSANSAALSNVTEDRTVYAAYKSTVRSYTITYYDEDGTTELYSEVLEYGAMPSYVPVKDGVSFDYWTPALTAVNGNASYIVKWAEGYLFSSTPWDKIKEICDAGEASKYFKVGDTREETFGTDVGTVTLMIMGFNHDDLADGSGKASMTIGMASNSVSAHGSFSATSNGITKAIGSYIKKVKKSYITKAGGDEEAISYSEYKTFYFSLNELGKTVSSPSYCVNAHVDGSETYEAVTLGLYSSYVANSGFVLRGYAINSYNFGIRNGSASCYTSTNTQYKNLKARVGFCI